VPWSKKRLGDFAPFNYGKGLPKEKRIAGDVLVYGSNGIVGSHNQSLLSEPVVVIGRKGSVGEVHLTSGPSWPIDTTFYAEDSGEVDLDFLFYLLQTLPLKTNSDSAVPGLSRDYAHSLEVQVPNVAMQTAIAKVLKSTDFKIANNSALSKTLEDIAQTIFKSWFIDFDPVKAKMAGDKPVGMDAATAALFPDSMEDSELGPVPSNWHAVPLTDLFDVLSGGTPKTVEESFWGGAIPWFSVVDAPESGGCFFIKTEKTITELGVSKSAAKIVRPGVTIISARGTVGKTAIVATPSTFNQSCYGLMGKYGDFFTYLLVKYMVEKLQNIAHGGMFDTITRETFSALTFSKPTESITHEFEKLVEPMFKQIMTLQYQSEQLSIIRDTLLPRLISGELQIPEKMLAS
jgi:type I restriction enzyme S subunit